VAKPTEISKAPLKAKISAAMIIVISLTKRSKKLNPDVMFIPPLFLGVNNIPISN